MLQTGTNTSTNIIGLSLLFARTKIVKYTTTEIINEKTIFSHACVYN